jgi:hypothetical protein
VNAKDAIRYALTSTQNMLSMYVSDLSDADLLIRPAPTANHIAWQLGHLIAAESGMGRMVPGAKYPELPAGFAEQHDKATSAKDPPTGFATKAVYLDLFNKVRGASLAALDKMPDADLDRPTEGRMAEFAPTVGALMMLNANHVLMHAGQFTVVRRKLGKPVLF